MKLITLTFFLLSTLSLTLFANDNNLQLIEISDKGELAIIPVSADPTIWRKIPAYVDKGHLANIPMIADKGQLAIIPANFDKGELTVIPVSADPTIWRKIPAYVDKGHLANIPMIADKGQLAKTYDLCSTALLDSIIVRSNTQNAYQERSYPSGTNQVFNSYKLY